LPAMCSTTSRSRRIAKIFKAQGLRKVNSSPKEKRFGERNDDRSSLFLALLALDDVCAVADRAGVVIAGATGNVPVLSGVV
jgi:hypothetical protein